MQKTAVIIPAYKPDQRLLTLLQELTGLISHIVIIDDGSGPDYREIFEEAESIPRCRVLRHEVNRGKGRALKTAFSYTLENFKDIVGVVTADADGQHSAEDIIKVAQRLAGSDSELVLGMRDFKSETDKIPFRSLLGNRFTSRLFQVLYGTYLEDTQTGLRGIPLKHLPWMITMRGERFDYELNMLINAGKKCSGFVPVSIKRLYFDNNSGSHYSTVRDSARVFVVLVTGLMQYSLASIASVLVDYGFFNILNYLVFPSILGEGLRIFLSTFIARVASSTVNYSVNRKVIFATTRPQKTTALRYYTIWFCQMITSYLLVYTLTKVTGKPAAFNKIFIDLLLSICSYQLQMHWVFGRNCKVKEFEK